MTNTNEYCRCFSRRFLHGGVLLACVFLRDFLVLLGPVFSSFFSLLYIKKLLVKWAKHAQIVVARCFGTLGIPSASLLLRSCYLFVLLYLQ